MPCPDDLEIRDLRNARDDELLEELYERLYVPSFPVPEEREDPSIWMPLLWEPQSVDGIVLHAFVAGADLDEPGPRRIAGLVFCEHYPRSASGLISYLAVDPDERYAGLGRCLVETAIEALHADAGRAGRPLKAVFAEIHDPERVEAGADVMDPTERASFFARLSARRVRIPYVQPELRHGGRRARNLHLIAFPLDGDAISLDAADVRTFLHDVYSAAGIDTAEDRDFQRMVAALQDSHLALDPLNPVVQQPEFAVAQYGIAFHFVSRGAAGELEPATKQFASFERDLLAYSYRDQPPFSSRPIHVPPTCRRISVQFPRELRFVSEGRTSTLVGEDQRPREVQVRASVTSFRSGIRVSNLVLTPRPGSSRAELNEYDLIRLVKLWEGGEDVTGPYGGEDAEQCVRFGGPDDWRSIRELARDVFEEPAFTKQRPRAGIVQLLTNDRRGQPKWRDVWADILALKQEQGIDTSMPSGRRRKPLKRMIEGISGIVQGLVDFEEIDAQELREVFAGIEVGEDGLVGIHKGTLIQMGVSDRPLVAGIRSYGISPYLLIPHTVLLHNEELLDFATEEASKAAKLRRLGELESSIQAVQRAVEHDYLPDVFHYPGERLIMESGLKSRGLTDRRDELLTQLGQLRGRWSEVVDRRRGIADDVRNGLLLILGYTSFRAAFPGVPDWILIMALVMLTVVYVGWRWRHQPPWHRR
jgi:GNAT superfamily N-acetyltransferase